MHYRLMGSAVSLATLAVLAATPAHAQTTTAVAASEPAPYRLVEVAGKPLPTVIEKEWNCREEVTAGTLTLRTDGTWRLETTTREVCGNRAEQEIDAEHGRYTVKGDSLQFYDEDGHQDRDWHVLPDIDIDDLETGALAGDSTLTVQLDDRRTNLLFRK